MSENLKKLNTFLFFLLSSRYSNKIPFFKNDYD